MHHILRHSKKFGIAVIGGLVFLVGVVMIPYPGPGWLVVFAGLAILATEFEFAARALTGLRHRYEMWVNWLKRQSRWAQVVVLLLTGSIVVLTLWVLNAFGLMGAVLVPGQDWLSSPLLRR